MMQKICMTEDIPEREARSFETPKGDTIFSPNVMVPSLRTKTFARICKLNLNFWKTNF